MGRWGDGERNQVFRSKALLRVSKMLAIEHVLDAKGSKNLVSDCLPGFVQSPISRR